MYIAENIKKDTHIEIHLKLYKSLVIRQVFKLKLENLEQIGQFFCNRTWRPILLDLKHEFLSGSGLRL